LGEDEAMNRLTSYLQGKLGIPELVKELEDTRNELATTRKALEELNEIVDRLDNRTELLDNPAVIEIFAALKAGGVI